MPKRHLFAWLTGALLITAAFLVGQIAVSAEEAGPPPPPPPAEATPDPFQAAVDAQIAKDLVVAEAFGQTIGPVPDGGVHDLAALPDLIPVIDADGVIGYARPEELFVEEFDPNREFIAYGIYGPDGRTLRGHDIPGKGFVPGSDPIETSRQATVPVGDSPLSE